MRYTFRLGVILILAARFCVGEDYQQYDGDGGYQYDYGYDNGNGDAYGYGNNNGGNGNGYGYSYGQSSNDGYLYLKNCAKSVVATTSVKLLCDSPYTFYYGNGAHRNSPQCDYGDKARIAVSFNVTSDIDDDDEIYISMAVYSATSDYELLYALRAVKVQFDILYGDNKEFDTVAEIGYSTKPDEGYNLGGSNIDCWYNQEYDQSNPWIRVDSDRIKTKGAGSFFSNYGILLFTLSVLSGFACYVVQQLGTEVEYKGKMGGLLDEEASPISAEEALK